MYRGNTVGVVLPAYNEVDCVGSVVESLPSFVDVVYAVDDCSTDGTWDVIREYATTSERPIEEASQTAPGESEPIPIPDGRGDDDRVVVPIRHETNRGAGGALKTGYRLAERDGMDATVTIDADGQMDPEQMSRLLDPIVEGQAGFSKGNRLADGPSADGMPGVRFFGNWLLTLLMKPASGYWGLRDPQNGYTAISADALSAVDIQALPDNHDYPNDLLARLHTADVRIADVSMPAIYGDEESTIDFTEFVRRTSKTILASFLRRLRRESRQGRPGLPVLYSLGVFGLLVGALSAASTATESQASVSESMPSSWPVSVLLVVCGGAALWLASGVERHVEVIQG